MLETIGAIWEKFLAFHNQGSLNLLVTRQKWLTAFKKLFTTFNNIVNDSVTFATRLTGPSVPSVKENVSILRLAWLPWSCWESWRGLWCLCEALHTLCYRLLAEWLKTKNRPRCIALTTAINHNVTTKRWRYSFPPPLSKHFMIV